MKKSTRGKAGMAQVPIDLIDSNPYRNMKINPINMHHVGKLATSYESVGDFSVLIMRPVGDRYQIASGHHRLAAQKQLGFITVDSKVESMSDDMMIDVMIRENDTQIGKDPSHQADAVAAAVTRVAYWMFLAKTVEEFNALEALRHKDKREPFFPGNVSVSSGLYANATGELYGKNPTIGRKTIVKYIGSAISEAAVRRALPELQASGTMADIIRDASEAAAAERAKIAAIKQAEDVAETRRIAAEIAAADRRAKERVAEEKKIAKRAAQLKKQQKEDQEEKEKLAALKEANDLKQQKAALAKQAREAEIHKQLLADEAEKIEQDAIDQAAAEVVQQQREADAVAAAEEQLKMSILDPGALALLGSGRQAAAFLAAVKGRTTIKGSKNPKDYRFSKANIDQVAWLKALAVKIRATAPEKERNDPKIEDKDFLTEAQIVNKFNEEDTARQAKKKAEHAELQLAEEARNKGAKADRMMKEFFAIMSSLNKIMTEIDEAVEADSEIEMLIAEHPFSDGFQASVGGLYHSLPGLQKKFEMWVRRVPERKAQQQQRHEEVINAID